MDLLLVDKNSDEGIIIGFTYGEALGSTLGLDDEVTLCLQE